MEQERCPHVHPKLNLRKLSFESRQAALDWLKANGQTTRKVYRCKYRDCRKWHLHTVEKVVNDVGVNVRTKRILETPFTQSLISEELAKLLQEKFGEGR